MARNLFTYALLGGIAGGGDALARGMENERRMEQELAMRKALQDDQQAARMEQLGLAGRVPGVGGPSGSRAGGPAISAAQAVSDAETIMTPPSRERVAEMFPGAPTQVDPAYAAEAAAAQEAELRGQAGPPQQMLDESGKPRPVKRVLDEEFYRQKVEQIVRYRKAVYGGANADDMAKGEQTLSETNLLEKASKGDRAAGEGLLYSKGKDPQETVARAEAQKAEADKDRRTDPNARRGGGSSSTPDPVKALESERKALKDAVSAAEKRLAAATTKTRAQAQAEYDEAWGTYKAFTTRYGGGLPVKGPAQSAASAPTRPPLNSYMKN